jgi:hypothetical protein
LPTPPAPRPAVSPAHDQRTGEFPSRALLYWHFHA